MLSFKIKLTLNFFLFLNILSTSFCARVQVGAECDNEIDCQSLNVHLTCLEGVCECITDPDINFDPDSNTCISRLGTSCYKSSTVDLKVLRTKFYTSCQKNASCSSPSKICECDQNYYADGDLCLPKKEHLQLCDNDFQCNSFNFLKCINNNCDCPSGMLYNEKIKSCFTPIGSNCTRATLVENPNFKSRYDSCPPHADCLGNICKCRFKYRENSDRICAKDHGAECSISEPCSDLFFQCHSKKCECNYAYHQYYDKTTAQCISFVPGPCQSDENCTPDAECVKNQCRCKSRFLLDKNGRCLRPWDYACEIDSECFTKFCINERCGCADLLFEYDKETRKCLGKIGARCELGIENVCIKGAICKELEDFEIYGSISENSDYGSFGECVKGEISSESENEEKGENENSTPNILMSSTTSTSTTDAPDEKNDFVTRKTSSEEYDFYKFDEDDK